MSDLSPSLLLKAARNMARRYTPESLRHWQEDIEQDAVLHALRMVARSGVPVVSPQALRWAVHHAVRRLLFLLRYQAEGTEELLDGRIEGRHELGPIALWRLQGVWPDLTDVERLALGQILTGDSPTSLARAHGIAKSTLHRARAIALARLDNPSAYSRTRCQSAVSLSADRPQTEPGRVAAHRARDAEYARRRRASHA